MSFVEKFFLIKRNDKPAVVEIFNDVDGIDGGADFGLEFQSDDGLLNYMSSVPYLIHDNSKGAYMYKSDLEVFKGIVLEMGERLRNCKEENKALQAIIEELS